MVRDKREFVRLDVGYMDNPKIADVLDTAPRAVLAHIASIAFARQHRTDGVIPYRRILRKVGANAKDARALFSAGLWEDIGDDRAQVHDYLEHQESAEQIVRLSEAGRKGAAGRWSTDRNADRNADRMRTPDADRNAEERRGEERTATQSGADGADGPQNAMAILASVGLITPELRRDYLAALKARGIERPTRFVVTMHGRGEIKGDVEDWLAERDASKVVPLRPGASVWDKKVPGVGE